MSALQPTGEAVSDFLARAVRIVEALHAAAGPMPLSEIARSAGVPKSTAHRMLSMLVALRVADRSGTEYVPGRRLPASDPLPAVVCHVIRPYLVRLHRETGQVALLAGLRLDQAVITEAIFGPGQEAAAPLRGQIAARRTALGKVLLATSRAAPADLTDELAMVRSEGIATSRGDYAPGLAGIAAPVAGRGGRPVGAIGLIWRSEAAAEVNWIDRLRAAAHHASVALRRLPLHPRTPSQATSTGPAYDETWVTKESRGASW